jgi:thermolabile hemolysin
MRHRRWSALALALAASFACTGQAAPLATSTAFANTPDAHDPVGPDRLAAPLALAGETFTYVRCHYRLDPNANTPATEWTWATRPDDSYYTLPGRWADGGLFSGSVFHTDYTQGEIVAACEDTVRRKGGNTPLQMVAAANNRLQPNYSIWSNDAAHPGNGLARLVVFGDSLSDTGNVYNLTLGRLPNLTSWSIGHFSNGKVWAERAGERAGLDLFNFAYGSAAADGSVVIPGVRQQVDSWISYRKRAPAADIGRNLFAVMIGGNDLINYNVPVPDVLATVRASLDALIADGARHVLLMNLPDVSRAPVARLRTDGARLAQQVRELNAGYLAMRNELAAAHPALKIQLFDTSGILDRLLNDPAAFGIDNVTDSCLDINQDGALNYLRSHAPRSSCVDADRRAFWDLLHPSRRTHAIVGDAVAEFIGKAF